MIDAETFEILDSKFLTRKPETEMITILKYSPEGKTLICATSSGKIWTIETDEEYLSMMEYELSAFNFINVKHTNFSYE
jgi:hypothetical protein